MKLPHFSAPLGCFCLTTGALLAAITLSTVPAAAQIYLSRTPRNQPIMGRRSFPARTACGPRHRLVSRWNNLPLAWRTHA
jgi:hypothetical protein